MFSRNIWICVRCTRSTPGLPVWTVNRKYLWCMSTAADQYARLSFHRPNRLRYNRYSTFVVDTPDTCYWKFRSADRPKKPSHAGEQLSIRVSMFGVSASWLYTASCQLSFWTSVKRRVDRSWQGWFTSWTIWGAAWQDGCRFIRAHHRWCECMWRTLHDIDNMWAARNSHSLE